MWIPGLLLLPSLRPRPQSPQFMLLLLLQETPGFNYSSTAYFAVWSQSQVHEKDLILSKGKTLLDNTYLTADPAGINNNTKIWVWAVPLEPESVTALFIFFIKLPPYSINSDWWSRGSNPTSKVYQLYQQRDASYAFLLLSFLIHKMETREPYS